MTYGETAEQAALSVKRSLRGNVRIASPKDFRDTFLPVSDNGLDQALLKVKQEFYDNDQGRWKYFPSGKNESEFYQPFQAIAEAVNTASRAFKSENAIHTTWLDRHSKAPYTKSKDAAAIRPDIVQVSVSTQKDFDELDEHIQQSRTNKENELKIWWMHIHTVVEIKPTPQDSEHLHNTIIQLCSYIRQLFREQLDRRFAIALLLCGNELTLWYCDRVGLVGTIDPINIHANPDDFMKVLAAFSILPADKLGWDPTMKLYQGKGKTTSPSYLVSQAPNTGLHGLNWCISMPDMSGQYNRSREEFVTVRAITTLVFQHMCSRASIVWEVVKKEDYENCNSNASVFVLKQAWQATLNDATPQYDGVLEVKMHEIGGWYKDRYRSHETVRNEKGEAVSTDLFRIGLTIETYASAVQKFTQSHGNDKSGQVQLGKRIRPEDEEPFAYIKLQDVTDSILNVSEGAIAQHPRTLVRQLLTEFGYPLKCFIDNLELITVIHDAVEDHEKLYDRGVLHRDISEGNILIRDSECDRGEGRTDRGMLIDLDHAKHTEMTTEYHISKTIKEDDVGYIKELYEEHELADEIYRKALRFFDRKSALHYLELKVNLPESVRKAASSGSKWNEGVFKWPKELKPKIPDYSKLVARAGLELTGTIPFISVELLRKRCFQREKDVPIHNAVHDMESLFWVLVHHCLTRDGNAGNRRRELSDNSSKLAQYVNDLFSDNPKNYEARSYCLEHTLDFGTMLGHIHSYFDPLQDLLAKWRWLLMTAYDHDGVEYYNIHGCILIILEETIEELKQKQEYDMEADSAKKIKRKKDWRDWRSQFGVPAQVRRDEEEHDHGIPLLVGQEQDDMETSDGPLDSPSAKRSRKQSGPLWAPGARHQT